jgi:2-oxoglutarate dehydrogenase E1 component
VLLTPKSLLRARTARSPVDELTRGSFREVLDDEAVDPASARRVVLCSGKIAAEATAWRDEHHLPAAVVRVEQLYPWPEDQVAAALARYESAAEVVWLQEEPENMGAWSFVHGRLHRLLRDDFVLRHVSRYESASPACGSAAMHKLEQQDLLERALA